MFKNARICPTCRTANALTGYCDACGTRISDVPPVDANLSFGIKQSTEERYKATRLIAKANRILGVLALILGVIGGVAALAAQAGVVALAFPVMGGFGLLAGLTTAEGLQIFLDLEQTQRRTDFRLQQLTLLIAERLRDTGQPV